METDGLYPAFGDALLGPCGVRPGSRVLVACSGGLDSTVLLDLLIRSRDKLNVELTAATIDHGLRPDAGIEAEHVRRSCEAAGIPWSLLSVRITDQQQQQHGVEAAARQERHGALGAEAQRIGARFIALAHHRDDQAETVLMRALVGTGIRGLAAMRPRAGDRIRPLLEFSRKDLLNYAKDRGLTWREDPSNEDMRYLRNRIRHQLMPRIEQVVDPSSAPHLAALAQRCAVDDRYLTELAEQAAGLAHDQPPELPIARIAFLDRALQVRILLALVHRVDAQSFPGHKHLDAALALLEGSSRRSGVDLPGGLRLERDGDRLRALRPAPRQTPTYQETALVIPGSQRWPGTEHVIHAELHQDHSRIGQAPGAGKWRAWFDQDQLTSPVRVHTLKPGCRIRLHGGPGSRKISDLLSEAKIPRELRASWPIIADAERVLWVPGCRSSDAARVDTKTEWILELKVEDNR